jgi:hypothetical protein
VALLGAAALVPFVEKKPAIRWYRGFPVSEGRTAATPDGDKLEVSLSSPFLIGERLRRLLVKKEALVAATDALVEAQALDAGWVELMKDTQIGGKSYERVYARATARVEEVRAFFPGAGDTLMFRFFTRPLPLMHRSFPIGPADSGFEQSAIEGGERIKVVGRCETEEPAIWGWKGTQALHRHDAMGYVRGDERVEVEPVGWTCELSFFP